MDSGGGTGAPEQDSGDEDSDQINEHVRIAIETLPTYNQIIGDPPNQVVNTVHTIIIRTASSTVTLTQAGYQTAPPDFLLLIAEEVIRAARSRLRRGVVQIISL